MKEQIKSNTFNSPLNFSAEQSTGSTNGCFLKVYRNGIYYKLSNYDSYLKSFGWESLYEVIAYHVGTILGFPVLEYWIETGKIIIGDTELVATYCASRDFNSKNKNKISIESFVRLHKGKSAFDLADEYGFREYINQIMIFDYIICNRDRHGANIELLFGEDGSITPSPIFDNGLSFLFSSRTDEAINKSDPLMDPRVNNYLGSQSLECNLDLVTDNTAHRPILFSDRDIIFYGIEDHLSTTHKNKIMEMLVQRSNKLFSR